MVPLRHHRLIQRVLPRLLVQCRVHIPVIPPQHRPQVVVCVVECIHQRNSIWTHLSQIMSSTNLHFISYSNTATRRQTNTSNPAYLCVKLAKLLICQRSLLRCDAPSCQEVAQVLVKNVEGINIAKVLELFLHSMSRNVLLYLCNEPSSITQVEQ